VDTGLQERVAGLLQEAGVRIGGTQPQDIQVHDPRFFARVMGQGSLGLGESYMEGWWDANVLDDFLVHLMQAHLDERVHGWREVADALKARLFNLQVGQGSYEVGRRHYDLGNAFYREWLDPSMTYSSALFEDGTNDLTAAQHNKYRRLAEAINLQPGQRVLEIGCGWGGFAEYVAKNYDARVVGLTISTEQRDFALKRMQAAGLSDKVEIRFQDYRDERGQYDRIASIEMIEAVGEEFWPQYFSQLRDRLAPGGLAGIQAITIQDKFFNAYRREVDFIQRYVFPGGMLPSPQVLKSLGEKFGVPVIRERIFGEDYAKTLATWRDNFRAAWPNLMPLGFDERFRRLWEYYLAYCEAGFLSGNIDVRQVVFAKSG